MTEIRDQYGRDITAMLQDADNNPIPSGSPQAVGVSAAPPVTAPPQTPQAAPTKPSELAELVARLEALEATIARVVGHIFGA